MVGGPGDAYLAISPLGRTGPRLTKNQASAIVLLLKFILTTYKPQGSIMPNERVSELRRRRHRKAKLTNLKKKLEKASKSEKGIIAAKVRRLSPGAEQLLADWKIS